MIILYGGSFNPPTIAHYRLSKYLIEKYKPTQFIFIPVGDRYNWKSNLAPFRHRFEMVRIMCQHLKDAIVSDYEAQPEYKGTITTLRYFQSLYPNEEIVYVIGADNLLMITKWIKYEELLKEFRFLVLQRNGINIEEFITTTLAPFKDSFIIESDAPLIDIAATDYRDFGRDDVCLAEINQYIYEHKLYGRGEYHE